MSVTLDERARAAGDAVRAAAELRPATEPSTRTRAPIRVVLTAVVLVVVIAVAAFFAVRAASPRKGGVASQPNGQYRATAVLISVAHVEPSPILGQSEQLLRIGVVPNRVAQQLHAAGTPQRLVDQVHITTDQKDGRITITSDQPTAARAMAIVNAFADQLVRYLDGNAQTAYNEGVNKAADLTHQLAGELVTVQARLARNPNDAALKTRALALHAALSTAQTAYAKVVSIGADVPPLRLVEADNAVRLEVPSHPRSHRSLLVALAVIALLAVGGAAGFGVGRRRTGAQT